MTDFSSPGQGLRSPSVFSVLYVVCHLALVTTGQHAGTVFFLRATHAGLSDRLWPRPQNNPIYVKYRPKCSTVATLLPHYIFQRGMSKIKIEDVKIPKSFYLAVTLLLIYFEWALNTANFLVLMFCLCLHVFVPLNETYQSGVCNLRTQDTSAAHLVTQHYDTGNRCDDARPRRWQGVGDVIHAVIQPVWRASLAVRHRSLWQPTGMTNSNRTNSLFSFLFLVLILIWNFLRVKLLTIQAV